MGIAGIATGAAMVRQLINNSMYNETNLIAF